MVPKTIILPAKFRSHVAYELRYMCSRKFRSGDNHLEFLLPVRPYSNPNGSPGFSFRRPSQRCIKCFTIPCLRQKSKRWPPGKQRHKIGLVCVFKLRRKEAGDDKSSVNWYWRLFQMTGVALQKARLANAVLGSLRRNQFCHSTGSDR